MTLSIKTLSLMTLSITTISLMTLSITTFSLMTLRILKIGTLYCYAERLYAEFRVC